MSVEILAPQWGYQITFPDGTTDKQFQSWMEDMTFCVNDFTNGTGSVSWGNITGSIEAQTDLVSYVADNFTIDSDIDSDATISADRGEYNVDASGGDVTITLPALGEDKHYKIRRVNATGGDVIITGSEDINGSSSVTIVTQYVSLDIGYAGSEWGLL